MADAPAASLRRGPIVSATTAMRSGISTSVRFLTPVVCMSEAGPLSRNTPGDLTRWMGVPWQSDAASCQNIYVPKDFPLPVWWPSTLPVDVLPEYAYQQVMDTSLAGGAAPEVLRLPGVNGRAVSATSVTTPLGGYVEAMINMVNDWSSLGVIVPPPPARPTTRSSAFPTRSSSRRSAPSCRT